LNLIRVMPAKGQDRFPMANSIFLAKLMGPVMLAVGIAVLINGTSFRSLAEEFLRSHALIFLSGLITMSAGVAILLTHSVWVANWPVLITILGWLMTIGGAVRIVCPQSAEKIGHAMLQNKKTLYVTGGVWIVLGASFTFFGYVR
jgi:hypothetical protein